VTREQYSNVRAVPVLTTLFEGFGLGLNFIDGTNIVGFAPLMFLPANLALPNPDEFQLRHYGLLLKGLTQT
jgi:hypothetical protein